MNGITEEAGKVAVATIESMKSQPMLLGLLVLNAIGIAAACWFLAALVEHSAKRYDTLLRVCLPHVQAPKSD
jgi:hypothetical protein